MRTATTTLRPHALTLASAGLLLAGCGNGSAPATGERADPAAHNDADVAFATQMVPHHAEALSMADLAIGRPVSDDFADLLDDIRAAQVPEIERMVDWLEEWGEPVPATMRDHAHADHGAPDGEMGGMDQGDLDELADASRGEFEDLWLAMMIEHHRGAIDMAATELDEGSYGAALELAEDITTSQGAEIERMQEMLDG